jgi:hypothetical protein
MSFGALWLFGDKKFDPSTSRALIMVLPLLVTNIVSASLMGYKMWCVSMHLGQLPRACVLIGTAGNISNRSRCGSTSRKTRKRESSASLSSSPSPG